MYNETSQNIDHWTLNSAVAKNKHRMKWCELREYKWNEYVTIAVNRNLSNCEKAQKKDFRASGGFEPVASALALQCSTSLNYEDPCAGGRPIYWVHQPGLFRNCVNCDSLRWSHIHFICIPAVHIISFCVSFLSRVDELNKLAGLQCMGLHSSGW